MQYSNPPTTTSKLQLNYRTTIIQNHMKSNLTEVLQLRIHRKNHIKTGRRGRDAQRAGPIPTCGG